MYTIKRLVDEELKSIHKEMGSAIMEAKMRATATHEPFVVVDDKNVVQCIVYDLPHLEKSVSPVEAPKLPKKKVKWVWYDHSTWFYITAGWAAAALFKVIWGRDLF
jgi:hypothetical protein